MQGCALPTHMSKIPFYMCALAPHLPQASTVRACVGQLQVSFTPAFRVLGLTWARPRRSHAGPNAGLAMWSAALAAPC